MAPPRKTGSVERDDSAADPERNTATQVKAVADIKKPTQTRAGTKSARIVVSKSLSDEAGDGAGEYHTGQNYQSEEDEGEGIAGSVSLEGDGLDPVDPEMVPRTKVAPPDDEEGAVGDDEGADAAAGDDDEGGDSDDGGDDAPPAGEGAPDSGVTRALPPIKLEIIAGPDAGTSRSVNSVRLVIGRTPGVDFLLADQSVSRRHVELVHSDGGTLMRDLGSGNGTKVNGVKVAEKILVHGDEIAIGKTKIRFVDELAAFKKVRDEVAAEEAKDAGPSDTSADGPPDADDGDGVGDEPSGTDEKAAKPSDTGVDEPSDGDGEGDEADGDRAEKDEGKKPARPRPVRSSPRGAQPPTFLLIWAARFMEMPTALRTLTAGGVLLVIALIVLGIAMRPSGPTPEAERRALAEQKMQEARNAARESRFEDAVKAAEAAERLAPGIDKSKIAQSAKDEVAALAAIAEARGLLEAKRFEDVRTFLTKAPKGSGRLDAQFQALQKDLQDADIAYRKEQIEQFIASGDIEAAKATLSTLPVEHQSEAATKITDFETQLEDAKHEEERLAKLGAVAAAAERKRRREAAMLTAFAGVERKFAGSEWDRAASECSRVIDAHPDDKEMVTRAKRLQGLIPAFGRSYDEGVKKFKQGQLGGAARPLRTAYQVYGQLDLQRNTFGPELEQKLAQAALAAGRDAMAREDWAGAAVNFRDAAKLDPNEPKARQGLNEMVGKADELYRFAYSLKDRDPAEALKQFKLVVDITPAGSPTHERAKNQIAAMTP